MNIKYKDTNKKRTKLVLEFKQGLSKVSLDQRQKRIKDGLAFLNEQLPLAQSKANNIQSKLARFREKNNLIEPETMAETLKLRTEKLESNILVLEDEGNRLKSVKKEIIKGKFKIGSFSEELSTVDL